MAFWDGFLGGINERRTGELERQRKDEDATRDLESKIALRLLDDEDPDLQEQGLRILSASMQGGKKKKGLQGFLGNLEPRENLRGLLELARGARGAPGQLATTPPPEAAAALPAQSPVETAKPQPSMLQRAVSGGAQFGAPTPAAPVGGTAPPSFEGGAASAPEVPGQASFGGINFADAQGTPAAAVPQVNVAAIADRVSRDGGKPQPGDRARLFYPSAARLGAQKTKSEFLAQAEVLQALGASPAETRRALMARMGAAGGQPNVTQAGYAKLADGTTVQTFTLEQIGGPPQLVYAQGGQFVPLPPGAQSTRMAGAAGGSQTSRMTGKQAEEFGLVEPGELDPNQYYSVRQRGDEVTILPSTAPSAPWDFQRGGGPFTPGVDRAGNPVDLPTPTLNPKVAAAKALLAAYQGIPSQMRMTQGQRQRAIGDLIRQYPVLQGLSPAQIQTLGEADDYLPASQSDALTRSVGGPGGPGGPSAGGSAIVPPPGDPTTTLPADWADRLAAEILKQQGRTMAPPPRPQ